MRAFFENKYFINYNLKVITGENKEFKNLYKETIN